MTPISSQMTNKSITREDEVGQHLLSGDAAEVLSTQCLQNQYVSDVPNEANS